MSLNWLPEPVTPVAIKSKWRASGWTLGIYGVARSRHYLKMIFPIRELEPL